MLPIKPFRQTPAHCGPAALKMVLDYFGVEKSEADLAKMCGASARAGTSAEGIVAAAKKLGFKGSFKNLASVADIRRYVQKKKIPVIVDWFSTDDGHYSVVADIDDKSITLQDPELGGPRVLDLEIFRRVWFDFAGDYPRRQKDFVIRRMIVIEK